MAAPGNASVGLSAISDVEKLFVNGNISIPAASNYL
jgi:hypothetical protein